MNSLATRLIIATTLLVVTSATGDAIAKSWCAQPLVVHEWGVQTFTDGTRPMTALPLPSFFHTTGLAPAQKPPVWTLPADNGVRTIPVLSFFGHFPETPVAIGVGFAQGDATVWFPQVDLRRSAAVSNSPAAAKARVAVEAFRAGLQPSRKPQNDPVPADPTRQLEWQNLALTRAAPTKATHDAEFPWVSALRALPDALWVTQPTTAETERFVFYEGATPERPALTLARGDTWAPGRQHLILKNPGTYAVHDVLFVHRSGAKRFVFFAPMIPAGAYAGFIIEEHAIASDADFAVATTGRLKTRLTAAPMGKPYTDTDCVMGRQPAVPVETATDHRVYRGELQVLLDLWAKRFFHAPDTTVTYREDPAYIDAMMPLSIYTDMRSYVRLSRLGLAVWEHVKLP